MIIQLMLYNSFKLNNTEILTNWDSNNYLIDVLVETTKKGLATYVFTVFCLANVIQE